MAIADIYEVNFFKHGEFRKAYRNLQAVADSRNFQMEKWLGAFQLSTSRFWFFLKISVSAVHIQIKQNLFGKVMFYAKSLFLDAIRDKSKEMLDRFENKNALDIGQFF